MELDYLKYFKLIADTGNLTKAAAAANISQSYMSKILSVLEGDAGVKLFDRVGRSLKLNSNGKLYLRTAASVITSMDELQAQLRSSNSAPSGSFTLAIQSVQALFPLALYEFQNKYPDIKIYTTSPDDENKLSPDLCDICILNAPVTNSLLDRRHLFSEPIIAAVSPEHPLANKAEVNLAELAQFELILPKSEKFVRLMESYFYTCGCTMNVFKYIENDREQSLNLMLGDYVVIAPLASLPPAYFFNGNYKKIVHPNCNMIIDIAWWQTSKLCYPATLFRDFMFSYYAESVALLESGAGPDAVGYTPDQEAYIVKDKQG